LVTFSSFSYPSPLIGGNFSKPVRKYPKLFDYEFLRRYPYFLPCVISSMVTAFGVIFGYFFLEEVGLYIFDTLYL